MDDKRKSTKSETEKSPDKEPAEEGLVDPRDLVDSEGSMPEVIRPKPLSEQSVEREPDQ